MRRDRFCGRFPWSLVGLMLLLVALASCSACGKSDAAADAAASIDPPVPAPEGLLAEVVVIDPNGSWGKMQRGTGGAISLMPMTLGGLVTSLASLDPSLGPEIDGTAPAFGAVATGPSGMESVSYALAVHLLDERRTRGTLFDGPNARYTARDAAGMTLLVAKGGAGAAPVSPVAAAISRGGYLLVARNEAELTRLGPYVARTLPARPRPVGSIAIEVPRAAFTGPLSPYLASLWASFRSDMERQDARMREAHGGKAPDFGDPRAIVEMSDAFVKDKMGILGDLDRARLVIDPIDDGVRIVASLVPVAGDGQAARAVRAMHVGDASPLLDVPKAASMALLARSDAEERRESARDASQAIAKALGDRIDADGREKLEQALMDWAKGRGDFVSASWLGGDRSGLLVRAPASDAESVSRAMHGLVNLADKPAFKGPLETFLQVRQISTSQVEVPGLGKTELVTFTRGEPKAVGTAQMGASQKGRTPPAGEPRGAASAPPRGGPPKGGMAWALSGNVSDSASAGVFVAAGEDPIAILRGVSENPSKAGEDLDFAGAVKRLGSNVTLALVVRRAAFDPGRAAGGLALVVGWGREGTDARAYLEASHTFVRELIRRSGGF